MRPTDAFKRDSSEGLNFFCQNLPKMVNNIKEGKQ